MADEQTTGPTVALLGRPEPSEGWTMQDRAHMFIEWCVLNG